MAKTQDEGNMLLSPTAPYNASAPMYSRMPQQMQFQPFMPGQQSAIANQLSQGFGAPAADYMAQMNQIYRPMNLTQMSEPLTQSMRSFGLQHSGKPGMVEAMDGGFNPQGYQQWGQSTGSPWLDAMFGLNPAQGVPATPADPNAPAPTPAMTWDQYRKTYKRSDGTAYPSRMNQSQFTDWQKSGGLL